MVCPCLGRNDLSSPNSPLRLTVLKTAQTSPQPQSHICKYTIKHGVICKLYSEHKIKLEILPKITVVKLKIVGFKLGAVYRGAKKIRTVRNIFLNLVNEWTESHTWLWPFPPWVCWEPGGRYWVIWIVLRKKVIFGSLLKSLFSK